MSRLEPVRQPLRGAVRVPGDKSVSHRAVMFGSVCDGEVVIDNFAPGADNRSTVEVFRALGAQVTLSEDARRVTVVGRGRGGLASPDAPLDCGNSGTTMRLTAGLLTGLGLEATLIGDASLSKRPMGRIVDPLRALGGELRADGERGRPPVVIEGGEAFQGGAAELAIASAQVKSALLLASLMSGRPLALTEPSPSRDHTEVMLRYLGAPVRSSAHYAQPELEGRPEVTLEAWRGTLTARPVTVPGDISSAAFLMVAAAIVPGSEVVLEACGMSPTRVGVIEALKGAAVRLVERDPRNLPGGEPVADLVVSAGPLRGFEVLPVDVPRLIDEVPILAVLAGRADGTTVFRGVEELKVKESDRLAKTAELLRACGREVEVGEDVLTVHGDPEAPYTAFRYDADHDHRMAAAAIVASLVADGPCEVSGLDSLDVSYPGLVADLESLQGREES